MLITGPATDVDHVLFETSPNLDTALKVARNSFVFIHPQNVMEENKRLTPVFNV